jgi:ABC-type uncharacterized transport system permease subunit
MQATKRTITVVRKHDCKDLRKIREITLTTAEITLTTAERQKRIFVQKHQHRLCCVFLDQILTMHRACMRYAGPKSTG